MGDARTNETDDNQDNKHGNNQDNHDDDGNHDDNRKEEHPYDSAASASAVNVDSIEMTHHPDNSNDENDIRNGLSLGNTTDNDDDDDIEDDDDEDVDEQVRRLAEQLAPQFQELDALLASPTHEYYWLHAKHSKKHFNSNDDESDDSHQENHDSENDDNNNNNNNNNDDEYDDDDDMDQEWSRLEASEQLLRQELEFAQDVSQLLGTPVKTPMEAKNPPSVAAMAHLPPSSSSVLPSPEPVLNHPLSPEEKQQEDQQQHADITYSTPTTNLHPKNRRTRNQKSPYTLSDHSHTIGLQSEPRAAAYYIALSSLIHDGSARDYVIPLPPLSLQRLFVGLVEEQQQSPSHAVDHSHADTLPSLALPVRTVSIRIRPDVLCGAVMDAMSHALQTLGAHVLKRQGGHLRGLVHNNNNTTSSLSIAPSYVVDAQLCTARRPCERTLLLRVYHVVDADEQEDEQLTLLTPSTPSHDHVDNLDIYQDMDQQLPQEQQHMEENLVYPQEDEEENNDWLESALRLQEAAALMQKLETASVHTVLVPSPKAHSSRFSWFGGSSHSPSAAAASSSSFSMRDNVTQHLLQHYKPGPSVLDTIASSATPASTGTVFPALSEQDWPLVQASCRWIQECWKELDTRDLSYSTLESCRFGAFPALPTLDVQFCSQLRRLTRESMIVSLLRSASELEDYARESEYACANLIQVLRPTFDLYGIDPPALPQPLPLTAYPLDFTPPQVICPPWGMRVMEALNQVAAKTSEANAQTQGDASSQKSSSFQLAQDAVDLVLAAFQWQDDEEQGARLGRKNVQVMDRLAKMQAHQRASMEAIRDSYGHSPRATKAADEFYSKALHAVTQPTTGVAPPEQQVPLFKCSVLVGTSTGTCYVTCSHILFVTQFIPIVGGNRCTLFDLKGLEFVCEDTTTATTSLQLLINPLPASVSIIRKNDDDDDSEHVVFSFRPSYGAERLVRFLQVVQADPNILKFSDRGGLLYLYGDNPSSPAAGLTV